MVAASVKAESFKHTFNNYSSMLNSHVFPDIQQYIKNQKFVEPLDKERSQQTVSDISIILLNSFNDHKIISIAPPAVHVIKVGNTLYEVYILQVSIMFLDEDETIKGVVLSSMLFGKSFILFIDDKSKIEV